MNITQKLSYGMYVVTSLMDGKPVGCVANCANQITSDPATFAVSINRTNYTNACINKCGKFAISVLATDSDREIIRTFGFKSARDTNKFAGINHVFESGLPVISDSCGYIVCEVIDTLETPTHTVFLGKTIASGVFSEREQMTYDYYHKVVKGSSPKAAPTYVAPQPEPQPEPQPQKPAENGEKKRKWICTVCGYEYEGDDLPPDIECPICGAGAVMFKEE